MKPITRMNRRLVLKGAFGVAMALPLLESFAPRRARAQNAVEDDTFAIFFRQANGVAQGGTTGELGPEPDRFWPTAFGPLTEATMAGRTLNELVAHRDRILALRNVNMFDFAYGDGHARGCMQGLTARGPVVDNVGGDSEADGESIDHRIARELNPKGRDSLFMFAGQSGGWLNGPSISYRASNQRRTALHDPFNGYVTLFGNSTGNEALEAQILARGRSVNDLVREQITALQAHPRLSTLDKNRLQLHFDSVRDLEIDLACRYASDEEATLEGASPGFDSTDGDQVLETARLHMDVAVLAISCGLTRSVAIQVGSGNDGATRYRNLDTGALMENFHFLSHRRLSHDSSGGIIAETDRLHSMVDVQFARTFKHLLDRLAATQGPNGALIDRGVACWYNDNQNGPPHGANDVPWILAGSCAGFFRTGEYLEVNGGANGPNHARLLNTIASAVGVRTADGNFINDHGDPSLPRDVLTDIMA
jgi:hypothetical protein